MRDLDPGFTASGPIIAVRDLVKRYKGAARNAVDGISFEVPQGQLFALLGPNGAGKTTTISILTTTLVPTSGSVRIGGHDLAVDPAAVRREIGIIFQQPSLDLNLTAEENVRFHAVLYGLFPFRPTWRLMPRAYRRQVEGLADLIGLSGELFRPVRTYSGGMRRRLEVIRSLMHRPRVLFLDEPTVGLDPLSRRSLGEYLRRVREEEGTTVFLTTHYLEEAEEADAICIINRGEIVAFGTPAEVKSELEQSYLLVDAADRAALGAELDRLGLAWSDDRHVRIELGGRSVQDVIRSIETPLAHIQTHNPSLEDAYLEIIAEPELEEALGAEPAATIAVRT